MATSTKDLSAFKPQLLPGSRSGPGATASLAAGPGAAASPASPQPRPHLCMWPLHDTLFSHPSHVPPVPHALTPLAREVWEESTLRWQSGIWGPSSELLESLASPSPISGPLCPSCVIRGGKGLGD